MANRLLKSTDNPELAEERKKASFDTDQLTYVIWDNKKHALRRREITQKVAQYSDLQDPYSQAYMDRPEVIDNGARKMTNLVRLLPELGVDPTNGTEMFHLVNEVIGIQGHPLGLHSVMFIPAIMAQADDEQQEWWLAKAINLEIIGTYAQTELGHGTNLRKLETTATYDKKTEEFVIHSPTITSMKWWPGNLGKSANHAIITASLIVDGKNYGPHNFFVQLRCIDTHMPLKGITVGDIGPKFEFAGTDNGFLKFDNVRIPRRHMLMRQSKVLPCGEYVPPPHAKMAYSAMVHVRSLMIAHQGIFLAYALIIAIRYSVIRRQGEITDGAGEVKILDYQSQQHRLFPQLARSFAFLFAGYRVREIYYKVLKDIQNRNSDDLADLHALTSGLKALITHQVGQGIEQARMACGGHGYSRASGIPQIYGNAIAGATYEGENLVMLLQTARYLMKAAKLARQGKLLSPMVSYLLGDDDRVSSIGRAYDPEYTAHLRAFAHIARKQVFKAYDRLQKLIQQGMTKDDAWNANAVEMQRASRLHSRLFIATAFKETVDNIADHGSREVMKKLVHLYLNYELAELGHYCQEDGYMCAAQLDEVKEEVYSLLKAIRPDAVSLVDAWDISDNELRSVLGRQDGHVYENLFEWAQNSQLNKTQVLPTFEKYLKPMMDAKRAQSKL